MANEYTIIVSDDEYVGNYAIVKAPAGDGSNNFYYAIVNRELKIVMPLAKSIARIELFAGGNVVFTYASKEEKGQIDFITAHYRIIDDRLTFNMFLNCPLFKRISDSEIVSLGKEEWIYNVFNEKFYDPVDSHLIPQP